jgi:glycosyltransferase involved in cell wall biosynthesis
VGLTKDLVRHIHEQGVEKPNIGLVHTYADFPFAEPTPRHLFDTPEDAPLLLALARLHWKKGLDTLLNALSAVPGAYLWIAGDGPLREELETQAKLLNIEDRVRFLGWRDDRGSLLAACDIVAFPSRYEPFGTVTVDAWAAERPLIAAASAGPKAYVQNEENGLLIEIDDTDALATSIRRLINEPDLVKKVVAGGKSTYEAQFTKDAFLRDSRAFYQMVADKAPPTMFA